MTAKDKPKVVVLGAGWLGQELCLQLQASGCQVEGTRTTANNVYPWSRVLRSEQQQLEHTLSLQQAYWVCAIPPRARKADSNYLATLQQSLELAQQMSAKGFLLCSSTGVYNTDAGHYNEQGELASKASTRINVLRSAEELVLQQGGKVLRLAGLQGPNREPGRFVAGKALSSSSNARVNMVERQDVIDAISSVLMQWQQAQSIYNVCYPAHPTREDYYRYHCQQQGTAMPSFAATDNVDRVIQAQAITELGFSYRYPIYCEGSIPLGSK